MPCVRVFVCVRTKSELRNRITIDPLNANVLRSTVGKTVRLGCVTCFTLDVRG